MVSSDLRLLFFMNHMTRVPDKQPVPDCSVQLSDKEHYGVESH